MESEETIKSILVDCLNQQICELEVLTSIYPNNGDIVYTNKAVLEDIKEFLDNKTQYTPNHLDFTLNLSIEDLKLEMSVNLPSFYPKNEPVIFIRCNQFNRQQETSLNSDLSNYIKNNHYGEQCLYTAISWIQDNIEKHYCKSKEIKMSASDCSDESVKVELKFVRLWVFSHHIYNKKKREEIMKLAKEYNLTGFCLPGKPGIVCIEGYEENCTNWWKIIKNLNWKKITIRKTEIFEESAKSKEQKFNNFEEISFHQPSKTSTHDMRAFFKFIGDHGLSHIINDLFKLSCT